MPGRRCSQRGLTLLELVVAVAIAAIVILGTRSIVMIGLEAQAAGREGNETAYQGRFALERIVAKARTVTPTVLTTPAAGTTGSWFAPTMYCRNAASQLIETTTGDTGCTGITVIASNVSAFTAALPTGAGAVDRPAGTITITLTNVNMPAITLSATVRLGGGVL